MAPRLILGSFCHGVPVLLFSLVFVLSANVDAQQSTSCPEDDPKTCPGVHSIEECPDEGCGGDDPELNERKNIRAGDQQSKPKTIEELQEMPNPDTRRFRSNNRDRRVLAEMGEGEKIVVIAWALTARRGGQETCNCRLKCEENTDNHIVLVGPRLKRPKLTERTENHSVTAEFTPRVKLDHPNFKRAKLNKLIDPDWNGGSGNPRGKLLVRVTGLLLFDSEHYFRNSLHRENDWEIHPILKLEYCPKAESCRADSDENWINFDNDND